MIENEESWRVVAPLPLTPILRGALESFHLGGYNGATVRDIASRVGVTVPALYYHHKNKQAMLVALLDASIRDVTDRVDRAVAGAGGDIRTEFANLIEAVVLHLTNRVDIAFLDAELRYLEPENRRAYADARRKIEQRLVHIIERGAEAGIFVVVSPTALARALIGMCQSITTWFRLEGPETPESIAQEYVEICLSTVDR